MEIRCRIGFGADPEIVAVVCHGSAAAPAPPDEAQALLDRTNFALSVSPNNQRMRGALNYRAANHEAAIADLNQSALVVPSRAWDLLFLAMAHSQLGMAMKRNDHSIERWIGLNLPIERRKSDLITPGLVGGNLSKSTTSRAKRAT
jgi:hypothetical protein